MDPQSSHATWGFTTLLRGPQGDGPQPGIVFITINVNIIRTVLFFWAMLHFPKQFTVGFSLRKKTGRDMLWPHPRSLSASCPPSALCPPGVRFGHTSKPFPPRVRHVSSSCLACVRLESALAAFLNFVRLVSALCPACVHFGCASKPCLPCVHLAFCPPCVR